MQLQPTWASPEPEADQVLVRRVRAPGGWRRRSEYEVVHLPDGRDSPPAWVRRSRSVSALVPGRTHPTDLHDLQVLVDAAWTAGEGAWTAWPVHHPAAVRPGELRAPTPDETAALAAWRRRSRDTGADAGPMPITLAVTRRGERVLVGLRHELTSPGSTRCGIARRDLEVLAQTFDARDVRACPTCARDDPPPA